MTATSSRRPHDAHHDHGICRAAHRIEPEQLGDGMRDIARRLLFSTRDLTDSDRQLLHDLAREEVRYPMVALCRFLSIATRSDKPEDREAFPELVRRLVRAWDREVPIATALLAETAAQGAADGPEMQCLIDPSPANRAAAADALSRHAVTIRDALDALAATP